MRDLFGKSAAKCRGWLTLLLALALHLGAAAETNPSVVSDLLDRIGGSGTAARFETEVDNTIAEDGNDVFVLSYKDGKPFIKGSSVLAVTTGINWYLNHTAHVNLAWNNLTTDLTAIDLPAPETDGEKHVCDASYRYYLNYCTFSYSMSTWTWERWQQEIDWMALHGINMPLQIVGLDVVWREVLVDLGYTTDQANSFIAGPCFQAWWGMNNLEGWGGPNPDWWYTRQKTLAQKILERERAFGMEPVLPGYAGMVPSDIADKKGYTAINQGNWCGFTRPYILDPNGTDFASVAQTYYTRLAEVMGTSSYYSMDPFHEGANTSGIDVASAYSKISSALQDAQSGAKWVIQFWQWSSDQYKVLSNVSLGKLIVLDLYSDAHTHFGEYAGHDAVYCALPNFGARTGLFGRLTKIMTDYYTQKTSYSNLKGVGATPEGIEQVPVLYDALFELPWRSSAPDAQQWLADYSTARYGKASANAQAAWEKVRNSALNCPTSLQGPQEAVLCARPSLTVDRVSSWGGTDIFYDAQDVAQAASLLLYEKDNLSGENYSYDLTDFTRQALTDYGYYLLKGINTAATAKAQESYETRRDAYLQLMLDLDGLLNTNKSFMLGRWTTMARAIATEGGGTSTDADWLEYDNARTLISTWGARENSETAGLRDYSYREWGGMMKDYYYARWKAFFDNRDNGTALPDWYDNDHAWATNSSLSYSATPTGSTATVAAELFGKYFLKTTAPDGTSYLAYRHLDTDKSADWKFSSLRGSTFTFGAELPSDVTATLGVDFNNDGAIGEDEQATGNSISVPSTATIGTVKAQLTLSDGTTVSFKVALRDEVTEARTVTVATADETQGTAAIDRSDESSVSTTEDVTVRATAKSGYDFFKWTDASGADVSTDNPYTYMGAAATTLTANFLVNKWGSPTEDLTDYSDVKSYGQYLTSLGVTQNGGDEKSLYTASECPSSYFQTTQMVTAAKGSELKLHWVSAGGLNYCHLSAYADLNSDGDFDDDGELLAAVGTAQSSGNTALNDYTLTVLLPYDATEGLTHIRLRFDGAWTDSEWDSATNAMPAKATAKRFVYDVPLYVSAYSPTACTVTVKSNNEAYGTVDASGQATTYTYGVGEDVVLRAYPADGYEVYDWTDSNNRSVPSSWRDGNTLRFKAPCSDTYTCVFRTDSSIPEDEYVTSASALTTSAYYRIETADESATYKYVSSETINVESDGKLTANSSDDERSVKRATSDGKLVPSLWRLTESGSGYTVSNANTGCSLGQLTSGEASAVHMCAVTTDSQWFGVYTFADTDDAGIFNITSDSHYFNAYLGGDDSSLGAFDADGTTGIHNKWKILEVKSIPVTVDASIRWASVCLPFPAYLPKSLRSNFKVYYSDEVEAGRLVLKEIKDCAIPAGAGVLLAYTGSNTSGTQTATLVIDPSSSATLSDNKLSGATARRTGFDGEANYFLALNSAGKAALLLAASDFTVVPANKAYLPKSLVPASDTATEETKTLNFAFDPTTGISAALQGGAADGHSYYDLSGRRVLYPANGIFVREDGKRVLIN